MKETYQGWGWGATRLDIILSALRHNLRKFHKLKAADGTPLVYTDKDLECDANSCDHKNINWNGDSKCKCCDIHNGHSCSHRAGEPITNSRWSGFIEITWNH